MSLLAPPKSFAFKSLTHGGLGGLVRFTSICACAHTHIIFQLLLALLAPHTISTNETGVKRGAGKLFSAALSAALLAPHKETV
jgi:hypothetical protein